MCEKKPLEPYEQAAMHAMQKWVHMYLDINDYVAEPKKFGSDAMRVYVAACMVYENRDDSAALEKALKNLLASNYYEIFNLVENMERLRKEKSK